MKIAILGTGNLGLSILNGVSSTNNLAKFYLTKRNLDSIKQLESSKIKIGNKNDLAIKDAEIILIAVKPYDVSKVLSEIKDEINIEKQIIVSLATGITIQEIKSQINPKATVFRAMPNTAADIGHSMTCVSTDSANQIQTKKVVDLFNSIGTTIEINENLMESATVLASCGIAYVLRFMRSMVQGGIQIGFDSKTANNIVNHVVKGAAELLIEKKAHPEEEIDKVTTPKGCTIVGLNEMEHNGFSSSLIKGISASYKQIEK